MLSPQKEIYRAEVFGAGADDCIQLPVSPNEILLRLSNALRVKRATDSLEEAASVITSLANAVEGRDAYTRGHVERVSAYSVELGRRVGCSPDDLSTLRMGGIVHDIGKVAVPDHILNKPGKLSDEEMAIIKRHPLVGFDILRPLRTFQAIRPIVRWHHERPNGTGYPDGLRGDDLPLLPRIVAVADFFDAISTDRSYRPAVSPEKCRETASSAADKEELDPLLVAALLEMLSESGAVPAETFSEAGAPAS
jgi:putative two-component system response regulator